MPLKFWKKDKPQKGKAEAGAEEPPKEKAKEEAKVESKEMASDESVEEPKVEEKKVDAGSNETEAVLSEIHAKLVDLGLTAPPTRGVFVKRVSTASSFHSSPVPAAKQAASSLHYFPIRAVPSCCLISPFPSRPQREKKGSLCLRPSPA